MKPGKYMVKYLGGGACLVDHWWIAPIPSGGYLVNGRRVLSIQWICGYDEVIRK